MTPLCLHNACLAKCKTWPWDPAQAGQIRPKCSKTAFWGLPGPTLRPGTRNTPKRPPGSFLGPLCGLGPEMLQNRLLEASWAHLRAGAGNASKRPSGGLLGPLCGLGPEMLQSGLLEASWPHFAGCLQAWGLDFYRNLGCILSLGARFLSQFASYPKPGGSFSIAICVVS